jgi:hypothetical protein
VESLALPNPQAWCTTVFGDRVSEPLTRAFSNDQAALLRAVDEPVVASARDGYGEIRAKKYENSCDDYPGELTFPLLMARITPVPLSELRMMGANAFRRISMFAHVHGTFRYVGELNIPDQLSPAKERRPPARIQLKGDVEAAKILKRVTPITRKLRAGSVWKEPSGCVRLSGKTAVSSRFALSKDTARYPRLLCLP